MSPSPAPQPPLPASSSNLLRFDGDLSLVPNGNGILPEHLQDSNSISEPLESSELDSMRARLHQLGLASPRSTNPGATLVERELAGMVLRLASNSVLHPSPTQLALQAETIAELTSQRDLLIQEREEQRLRWEVERQGWERSAEALLGKRRTAGDAAERDYVSE
ncbi:uncharacterized protein FIBRA_01931 [Fibroporia radiculosa]|uniref:Uncharacterized protein n=1 Tax=Fibroporia radiculosa TaxID=599839 RepID=J4I8S2_9APHY|nr:uncharacterized protein FIBRA_01931 [Fibroporia radiculosa]CCL99906.1 predicted protein [Fibroporia radiculosa]